jgi:O-antigen ligase
MIRDPWVSRSSASRSVLWVGIVLVAYPYLRMVITDGRFRTPWELVYLPFFVLVFFIWLFLYRREDLYIMIWMVAIGGLYKAIEAFAVFFNVGLLWGLLTGWRDAMLLTLMLLAGVFAYIIKPGEDARYARLRKFLIWTLPVTGLAFAGCLRRGYMIGFVLCLLVLIFFLNKGERRALRVVLIPSLGIIAAGLFLIDSGNLASRFTAIAEPGTEGSTAYRVLEYYNVLNMIAERPLTGWPMGTETINYTILDYTMISKTVPHNIYLYAFLRGGIVGLLVWLWMIGAMVRMHLRTMRAAVRPFERFMALTLASGTFLVIFAGFTTPIVVERQQLFYPFLMVMTSFLPGAWAPAKQFIPAFERA